jgi:predicted GNAT family N-acyltransferase
MENQVRESALNEAAVATARGLAARSNQRTQVRIARNLDDLLMVFTIRAAVYMAEQDCPYLEEFDGNDHCATHFIGFIDGEPAGCLRVRFFSDFAKLERLAVRKNFRRSTLAFDLVRAGIDFARRKGFTRIYGHSREGLDAFWARFGAKPLPDREEFVFSDYRYTEVVGDFEPIADPISLNSGPMVILRPEGDWDRPGVLEFSSIRMARETIENSVRERLLRVRAPAYGVIAPAAS